jgi:small multidrug resistance family-3 protein
MRNRRRLPILALVERRQKRLDGCGGGGILCFYGVVPTWQPANFGRVYAAYGGVFVVMSILWGWQVDRIAPDRFDLIGGVVCLLGVVIIMYWPRA